MLALFQSVGPLEVGVLLVLGLLLFGRRLPEVGRSLGRSIVEFKKGLKGVEDEIETEAGRNQKALSGGESAAYRAPIGPTGEDARVSRSASPEAEPRS